MSDAPLKVWLERDGALVRLRLARPKANLIDKAMIGALKAAFDEHRGRCGVLGALLDAQGPHFSFGASVEEHLAEHCREMLQGLHALLVAMLEWPAPILVAVRGQCLGGGLEVALAGTLIFSGRDARFGQPETQLGVFAPAASCLLPPRIGQSAAEDLLVSGRSIKAEEAESLRLVNAVADDPEAAALAYFEQHLCKKSGAAIACAMSAARGDYIAQVRRRLAEVERIYLEELMKTHDANEGLAAFLAKRPAHWTHR
jgi:cyclohexa-1,5-dienecarbonyl-CoA hydratase